jgi:hypothetical protein
MVVMMTSSTLIKPVLNVGGEGGGDDDGGDGEGGGDAGDAGAEYGGRRNF